MNKKAMTGMMILMLCLMMILAPAAAETRKGTIYLEGMEETIEETLFESPEGFSLWYANDWLEADYGVEDQIEGVVISTIYSDDYMVLSRVQTDLFRELKDSRYSFCSLVAEDGHYLLAVGQYAEEAAEGNAKFFQRVLDSVVFNAE